MRGWNHSFISDTSTQGVVFLLPRLCLCLRNWWLCLSRTWGVLRQAQPWCILLLLVKAPYWPIRAGFCSLPYSYWYTVSKCRTGGNITYSLNLMPRQSGDADWLTHHPIHIDYLLWYESEILVELELTYPMQSRQLSRSLAWGGGVLGFASLNSERGQLTSWGFNQAAIIPSQLEHRGATPKWTRHLTRKNSPASLFSCLAVLDPWRPKQDHSTKVWL